MSYFYVNLYIFGDAHSEVFIVACNGHNDPSSNIGGGSLPFDGR